MGYKIYKHLGVGLTLTGLHKIIDYVEWGVEHNTLGLGLGLTIDIPIY